MCLIYNFTFNIDVKLTAPCHSISIIRPAPPNVLRSHRQSNKTPQRAHNSHIKRNKFEAKQKKCNAPHHQQKKSGNKRFVFHKKKKKLNKLTSKKKKTRRHRIAPPRAVSHITQQQNMLIYERPTNAQVWAQHTHTQNIIIYYYTTRARKHGIFLSLFVLYTR